MEEQASESLCCFHEFKICFCRFWESLLFCLADFLSAGSALSFFAPYGLLLIPTIANFCISYFIGDLYTVVKVIVAVFSLQAGLLLALHYSFLASDVFLGVTTIFSYYTLEVPLGIAMSLVGIGVREESSNIIALCMHLAKELKQIVKRLSGKV